jgi:hypothetical protein
VATVVGIAQGMSTEEILVDFPYLQAEDTKAPLPTRLRLSESVSCPCAAGREVPVDAQSFAQGRPGAERVS